MRSQIIRVAPPAPKVKLEALAFNSLYLYCILIHRVVPACNLVFCPV